jgi:hypothetical protein
MNEAVSKKWGFEFDDKAQKTCQKSIKTIIKTLESLEKQYPGGGSTQRKTFLKQLKGVIQMSVDNDSVFTTLTKNDLEQQSK